MSLFKCFKRLLFSVTQGAPSFDANCPTEVTIGYRNELIIECTVTSDSDLSKTYFYWHPTRVISQGKNRASRVENKKQTIMLEPVLQKMSFIPDNAEAKTWSREGSYFGVVYEVRGQTGELLPSGL